MTEQNTNISIRRRGSVQAILSAWLLAGTLDITAASVYYPIRYNIPLTVLFQNIASGVFGEKAFAGGMQMAALGLTFHYCIAFIWTFVFYLAYPRVAFLRRNRLVSGIVYGLIVWLGMNLVVLPLSNVNRPSFQFLPALIAAVILMVCIGLPNSIIIGKYYTRR